jgi:HNH endonuclease/NUMOD4 motif
MSAHDDHWRPVPGFPNYQVSRNGEVRSIARNKLLNQFEGKRGYMHVNLYRDGQPTHCLVHRLIAEAFLGAIPLGWQVNHKRPNSKRDNRLDNLELVTPEQNRLHAARHGLLKVGESNPRAKLTEEGVRNIRRMRAEGVRVRDIAWQYDVSERAVYALCRGETWKHVD